MFQYIIICKGTFCCNILTIHSVNQELPDIFQLYNYKEINFEGAASKKLIIKTLLKKKLQTVKGIFKEVTLDVELACKSKGLLFNEKGAFHTME